MEPIRQPSVLGHSHAPLLTPSVSGENARLRTQLREAWAEIQTLRRTVAHQARLLEHLHAETHPASPSVNCVYWLWSETQLHKPSWRFIWNRVKPTLDGLGTIPAPELTPIVWERHRSARRRQPDRRGQTPCEHTLNIELGRAKGILDWAVENRIIPFNPLKAARYVKTSSRRETELRPNDIDAMLAAAEDVRDKRLCDGDDDGLRAKKLTAFILLCHRSMLRFDEARTLRRSRLVGRDVKVTGKGNKTRLVTLTPETLEAVNAVPAHPASDFVFANEDGKLHGATTMRGWFRWTCEHGRLDAKAAPRDKRIVPHHLRHAGATEADENGARPGALQLTLGHESIKTTERYIHRDAFEAARHVAEVMERRSPKKSRRT